MQEKIDKIRKLINAANDTLDTPERATARRLADKKLKELGLTDEDVMMTSKTMLPKNRESWESALLDVMASAYPCELHHFTDANNGVDNLDIYGTISVIDQIDFQFTVLRRSVLICSGEYHRAIRLVVEGEEIHSILNTFCTYAVIALSERILSKMETEETNTERPKRHGDQTMTNSQISEDDLLKEEASEDLLDDLMVETETYRGHHLPGSLDPMLCGYEAGQNIALMDALTKEVPRKSKQITATAGLISENPLHELEDLDKWSDTGW